MMDAPAIPTVSAIIPTFNRCDFLAEALASVGAQTRPPIEVIVVDDGSTDQTREMIETRFPDVHYIYQENQGVSAARNTGITAATGEWIALLDSDDRWKPRKLEKQMEALLGTAAPLAHTEEIWIRDGQQINHRARHQKYGGHIFEHCLPLCAISPSAAVIKRSLFDEVGGFDETLPACEDYDMWLKICCRYPVVFVDQHLVVKHGGHEDQLSKKFWGMDRFRIQALDNILESGRLDESQAAAARGMIVEKIDVYLIGARKRNKHDDIVRYEALRGKYS
jgi:glycosyltransferase involved in cell wall biosynthesis